MFSRSDSSGGASAFTPVPNIQRDLLVIDSAGALDALIAEHQANIDRVYEVSPLDKAKGDYSDRRRRLVYHLLCLIRCEGKQGASDDSAPLFNHIAQVYVIALYLAIKEQRNKVSRGKENLLSSVIHHISQYAFSDPHPFKVLLEHPIIVRHVGESALPLPQSKEPVGRFLLKLMQALQDLDEKKATLSVSTSNNKVAEDAKNTCKDMLAKALLPIILQLVDEKKSSSIAEGYELWSRCEPLLLESGSNQAIQEKIPGWIENQNAFALMVSDHPQKLLQDFQPKEQVDWWKRCAECYCRENESYLKMMGRLVVGVSLSLEGAENKSEIAADILTVLSRNFTAKDRQVISEAALKELTNTSVFLCDQPLFDVFIHFLAIDCLRYPSSDRKSDLMGRVFEQVIASWAVKGIQRGVADAWLVETSKKICFDEEAFTFIPPEKNARKQVFFPMTEAIVDLIEELVEKRNKKTLVKLLSDQFSEEGRASRVFYVETLHAALTNDLTSPNLQGEDLAAIILTMERTRAVYANYADMKRVYLLNHHKNLLSERLYLAMLLVCAQTPLEECGENIKGLLCNIDKMKKPYNFPDVPPLSDDNWSEYFSSHANVLRNFYKNHSGEVRRIIETITEKLYIAALRRDPTCQKACHGLWSLQGEKPLLTVIEEEYPQDHLKYLFQQFSLHCFDDKGPGILQNMLQYMKRFPVLIENHNEFYECLQRMNKATSLDKDYYLYLFQCMLKLKDPLVSKDDIQHWKTKIIVRHLDTLIKNLENPENQKSFANIMLALYEFRRTMSFNDCRYWDSLSGKMRNQVEGLLRLLHFNIFATKDYYEFARTAAGLLGSAEDREAKFIAAFRVKVPEVGEAYLNTIIRNERALLGMHVVENKGEVDEHDQAKSLLDLYHHPRMADKRKISLLLKWVFHLDSENLSWQNALFYDEGIALQDNLPIVIKARDGYQLNPTEVTNPVINVFLGKNVRRDAQLADLKFRFLLTVAGSLLLFEDQKKASLQPKTENLELLYQQRKELLDQLIDQALEKIERECSGLVESDEDYHKNLKAFDDIHQEYFEKVLGLLVNGDQLKHIQSLFEVFRKNIIEATALMPRRVCHFYQVEGVQVKSLAEPIFTQNKVRTRRFAERPMTSVEFENPGIRNANIAWDAGPPIIRMGTPCVLGDFPDKPGFLESATLNRARKLKETCDCLVEVVACAWSFLKLDSDQVHISLNSLLSETIGEHARAESENERLMVKQMLQAVRLMNGRTIKAHGREVRLTCDMFSYGANKLRNFISIPLTEDPMDILPFSGLFEGVNKVVEGLNEIIAIKSDENQPQEITDLIHLFKLFPIDLFQELNALKKEFKVHDDALFEVLVQIQEYFSHAFAIDAMDRGYDLRNKVKTLFQVFEEQNKVLANQYHKIKKKTADFFAQNREAIHAKVSSMEDCAGGYSDFLEYDFACLSRVLLNIDALLRADTYQSKEHLYELHVEKIIANGFLGSTKKPILSIVNCKSAKDRTEGFESERRQKYIFRKRYGVHPSVGESLPEGSRLKILMASAGKEIAGRNTGVHALQLKMSNQCFDPHNPNRGYHFSRRSCKIWPKHKHLNFKRAMEWRNKVVSCFNTSTESFRSNLNQLMQEEDSLLSRHSVINGAHTPEVSPAVVQSP